MGLLRLLLTPFSWVYGLGAAYRNLAYDKGWNPSVAFDLPVIAVGNLKTGGTGKTPHVEYLVRLLKADFKVATLSRGYGRKTAGYMLATDLSRAQDIGDEPRQLKQKFPDIEVAVGENRAAAIPAILTDEPGVQVIILDDAFQHRAVDAGLKILLTAWDDLYTDDALLPAGRLRESPSGAARADIVIVTKCPEASTTGEREAVRARLGLSKDKLFFSGIRYGAPLPMPGMEVSEMPEGNYVALSGLASASLFEGELEAQFPGRKQMPMRFRDHHTYTERNLDYILHKLEKVKGTWVMTTEKDTQRLSGLLPAIQARDLKVFYLPMEAYLLEREAEFAQRVNSFVRNF